MKNSITNQCLIPQNPTPQHTSCHQLTLAGSSMCLIIPTNLSIQIDGNGCLIGTIPNKTKENQVDIQQGQKAYGVKKDNKPVEAGTFSFTLDGWLLEDCRKQLITGPDEQIGYLTGVECQNTRFMNRFIKLAPEHSSVAYVKGEFSSSHNALMEMEKRDHRMLAWIHNHPGTGQAATHPSSTDYAHQERLERAGYKAIGIILARGRDYPKCTLVRTFTHKLPYKIEIYGKGVEQINEELYRLHEIS
jgi:hypothetical protein